MPCVGADLPGVESPDDDVEPALRLRLPDGDDIGETDSGFGDGVQRDVAAVAAQDHHDAVGAGLGDRRSCRVETRGVGGGERQCSEGLRIAHAAGGDASEICEHVLAAGR